MAATLAIAITVVGVVDGSVRHQLALSVVRQPDKYIELAFVNPLNLPEAQPAHRPMIFRFDLVAHGGEPAQTTYVISLSVAGKILQSQRRSVTTPEKTRVTVDGSLVAPDVGESYTVTVSLPSNGQHVEFHGRTT